MVVVIVESYLADCDHPLGGRQALQSLQVSGQSSSGLVRVDTDRGPDLRFELCERDGRGAGAYVRAGCDHGMNPGSGGASEDLSTVLIEDGVVQMRMAIDQRDHAPRRLSSSSATLGSSLTKSGLGSPRICPG